MRQQHMPQLDGLRTIAVAAVFWQHWGQGTHGGAISPGQCGVQLFFVLSGFLITGILLGCRDRDRAKAMRSFYARRLLRIFPLYYAVVLLAAALGASGAREYFMANLTYTTNVAIFLKGEWIGSVSHLWSLAVEEQFYLLWPLIVLFVPRRRLLAAFVAVIAGAIVSREVLTHWFSHANVLVTSNADALALGGVLAVLPALRARIVATALFWCGSAAVIIGAAYWPPAARVGVVMCCAWLVHGASNGFTGPLGAMLSSLPMICLGKISYGLYVIHHFAPAVVVWVGNQFDVWLGDPVRCYPLSLAFTVAIAALSWQFFERPINDMKRHFPYR